jgi:exopolysaccharide biosynthesis protein
MGPLHYLIVTTNREENNYSQRMPTIPQFARRLQETGCIKAYTLDGGQTGVIAMNGIMMNPKQYGSQRKISDIFYFATALPDGE